MNFKPPHNRKHKLFYLVFLCFSSFSYGETSEYGSPDTANTIDSSSKNCECTPINQSGNHALMSDKLEAEHSNKALDYLILPYKPNYLLPVAYNSNPNNSAYTGDESTGVSLDETEIKFQLSVKTPLVKSIFVNDDELTFAMTLTSWWQAYNSEISAPFRETNYEPLIMYDVDLSDRKFFNLSFLGIGFSHQSNGRSTLFSRSWNRIFARFMFEFDKFGIMFKPWYRIPEEKKESPSQAKGDDNPDIEDYMGNFEFMGFTKFHDNEFRLLVRNNLDIDRNRGAIQVDWTFPMLLQLRGYVQLFSGYGESLIDYNVYSNRVGVGFSLTRYL